MNKAVVTEVLSWGELWGNISPYYLPYLLGQMKGVSQGTHADRFNNLVFYAEDRDSLLFVSPITTTPPPRSLNQDHEEGETIRKHHPNTARHMTPTTPPHPIPTPSSREESHTLPELRPPDAIRSYADRVNHHQHQTHVDAHVLQARRSVRTPRFV